MQRTPKPMLGGHDDAPEQLQWRCGRTQSLAEPMPNRHNSRAYQVGQGFEKGRLPVLLDFPAPRLRSYVRETVIAEKLEAMVVGRANSRMKDLYDIWLLARTHEFRDDKLARYRGDVQAARYRDSGTVAGLPDPRLCRRSSQGSAMVGLPRQRRDQARPVDQSGGRSRRLSDAACLRR